MRAEASRGKNGVNETRKENIDEYGKYGQI